jgi:thiol-disulfide isomerase/thioredoxin
MSLSSWFLPVFAACCLLPVVGNGANAADVADATGATTQAAVVAAVDIGDPAPALAIGSWVQGDPVTAFDRDHAYLLEFWATWCGPCQAAIPHVNEIHRTFASKGLVVIGQNVRETMTPAEVKAFVAAKGDGMSYRVALDDVSHDPEGAMDTTWLKASGQKGIPASILVGKDGRIAWMGHPMMLTDRIISDVLAGTYDLAQAKRDHAFMQALKACDNAIGENDWTKAIALRDDLATRAADPEQKRVITLLTFRLQFLRGDLTAACAAAQSLVDDKADVDLYGGLAWVILTAKDLKPEHIAVGRRLAQRASDATQGKNAAIQDTLARALFLSGERDKAIATEQAAMELVEGAEGKVPYQKTLDAYRAGQLPATDE